MNVRGINTGSEHRDSLFSEILKTEVIYPRRQNDLSNIDFIILCIF